MSPFFFFSVHYPFAAPLQTSTRVCRHISFLLFILGLLFKPRDTNSLESIFFLESEYLLWLDFSVLLPTATCRSQSLDTIYLICEMGIPVFTLSDTGLIGSSNQMEAEGCLDADKLYAYKPAVGLFPAEFQHSTNGRFKTQHPEEPEGTLR